MAARVEGNGLDFRDEIYGHLFNPGDATPTGSMVFDICVSSHARKSGVRGLSNVKVDDWPGALKTISGAGFRLLALTPAPDAVPLQDLSAADRDRPALMLGAEGPGLTRTALAASDVKVAIPMQNGVDSLNVATAAAIAFWELSR